MPFDWNNILVPISVILMIAYAFCLILIFFYALSQLSLLLNYIKQKNRTDNDLVFDLSNSEEIPHVTIQLPVYNELYVIERLLDSVAQIEYPANKLEVQVLDDSTDESVTITAKKIDDLRSKGLDVVHVRRKTEKDLKLAHSRKDSKRQKVNF